jgi:hypothetical protein
MSVSMNQYLTKAFAQRLVHYQVLNSTISLTDYPENLEQNVLKVNIYFESLSYTSIQESASISLITMFSNVGGIAGLCLGCSILSLMESFEVIIKIYYSLKSERVSNA